MRTEMTQDELAHIGLEWVVAALAWLIALPITLLLRPPFALAGWLIVKYQDRRAPVELKSKLWNICKGCGGTGPMERCLVCDPKFGLHGP